MTAWPKRCQAGACAASAPNSANGMTSRRAGVSATIAGARRVFGEQVGQRADEVALLREALGALAAVGERIELAQHAAHHDGRQVRACTGAQEVGTAAQLQHTQVGGQRHQGLGVDRRHAARRGGKRIQIGGCRRAGGARVRHGAAQNNDSWRRAPVRVSKSVPRKRRMASPTGLSWCST